MRGGASRRRRASSPGTAPASSRACALASARAVDVRARPELETDERPDALGMIARALLVLAQERVHLIRARPPALAAAGIAQDVAGPAEHRFLKPAAEGHAEAAFRPI